jgi:DNA-binding NtrC family response regulator
MPDASCSNEILVIEDDPGFARILSVLNRRWGLPLVVCSKRGEIEAALAAPGRFGVIISDCHVPGMEVLASLASLRHAHPGIDLVLMSNLDERELRDQGEALDPSLIEPKEGIIREPEAFAARVRDLLARHGG